MKQEKDIKFFENRAKELQEIVDRYYNLDREKYEEDIKNAEQELFKIEKIITFLKKGVSLEDIDIETATLIIKKETEETEQEEKEDEIKIKKTFMLQKKIDENLKEASKILHINQSDLINKILDNALKNFLEQHKKGLQFLFNNNIKNLKN